jgi:hypothetical protein
MRGAEIGSGSNTASAVHVLPQTTENSKRTAGTSLFFCSLNRRWPRISAKNRMSAADNLPENSKAAEVERYPRMKPSISSDPQAIAWSMVSPCCVQRAIILVIVACEYICVAMLVGAGAQAIEATRFSRGG